MRETMKKKCERYCMEMKEKYKTFDKLTLELNLKTKEFDLLCKDFEKMKDDIENTSEKELAEIKQKLLINNEQIKTIKKKLQEFNKQ